MKKRLLLFATVVLLCLPFTSCEYYTTTASKLFDFKGEIPNPENTTPYENFEVEQQLALRDDHVCVMFAKNLTIDDDDIKYIGIDGGTGKKSTANILIAASNGANTLNWPTPGEDVTVHCQHLGKYAGADVWGVIIPRTYLKNTGLDSPDLAFGWKFVWGDSWDLSVQQTGVAPFIDPSDFNNCVAKLNTTDYKEAANF